MGEVITINGGKVAKRKPTKRKALVKRKKPGEPRSLSKSHRIRDGRAIVLMVPKTQGGWLVGEAYFHRGAAAWFWANTHPDLPGCDSISDLYDLRAALWVPMPSAPKALAA